MDSMDLEVLRRVAEWTSQGHDVTLVTVTKTWGSSPRPEGAMLAMRKDGLISGSVSGGCIEDDLIYRGKDQLLSGSKPEVVTYGVSAEEARRFGLPCGGTMQLCLEPITPDSGVAALLEYVEQGRLVARELNMASGCCVLRPAAPNEGLRFDGGTLVTIHGPRYRLLIIGASQLSRFLAEMALGLDYEVTICDPRSEYMDGWEIPGVKLLRSMPDDTVLEMKLDARCAVVALTHDPKLDDLALMEALKSESFYVGAIGSRANNEKRRERLVEFDVTPEQLRRLHGPIGIYVGSRTPPEIAVSIAAELTAAKNGVALPEWVRVEVGKRNRSSDSGCELP